MPQKCLIRIFFLACWQAFIGVALASGAMAASQSDVNSFIRKLRLMSEEKVMASISKEEILNILIKGRSSVSDVQSIDYFREQSNAREVRVLASLVNNNSRDIRINASIILANVVDNRNVCSVISVILVENPTSEARFNLLQVVKIVAGRALQENKQWIRAAVEASQDAVMKDDSAPMSLTLELMEEIRKELAASGNITNTLKNAYPRRYEQCLEMPGLRAVQ